MAEFPYGVNMRQEHESPNFGKSLKKILKEKTQPLCNLAKMKYY